MKASSWCLDVLCGTGVAAVPYLCKGDLPAVEIICIWRSGENLPGPQKGMCMYPRPGCMFWGFGVVHAAHLIMYIEAVIMAALL